MTELEAGLLERLGLPDPPPTTVGVDVVARAWGASAWAIYEGARRGDLPVMPMRIGRKMVWQTMGVLRSIGLAGDGEAPPAAGPGGASEVAYLDASRNGDRGRG